MSGPVPVISLRHLRKAFGATCALDDVSLDLYPGEVFALVGANGAGKSTLIKVLSGVYPDYEGEIAVGGVVERMRDPIEAQRRGILTVHQRIDEGLVPGLSTAENLTLDKLADGSTGAWYSIRRAEGDGREVARRMGLQLSRSALQADVRYLNVSDRQMVILARALSRFPRLLILDEPTAALSKVEADRLFQAVRLLKSRGVTVLYISHRLGEVEALADRIGVLRDGRLRALSTRPFSRTAIVETMLGKAVASELEHKEQRGEEEVLRLEGVRIDSGSPPIDLSIYRGEVIGITGLIGAGKSELLYGLAGVRPYAAGRVLLQRRPIAPQHPFHAVRAGIYLVPEDRSSQALIPEWSVKANLSLPFLRGIARLGFIRSRAEQRRARALVRELGIVCAGPEADIASLSGGNQQKVVIARWLWQRGRLLLLDEPFRGVDIGARRDISQKVRELASELAVVVASSDVDEILEVADRILVMANRGLVMDTRISATDRNRIVAAMTEAV